MDNVAHQQGGSRTEPGSAAEISASGASAKLSAFLASEDFPRFALDCLRRGAREAVAEQAALAARERLKE